MPRLLLRGRVCPPAQTVPPPSEMPVHWGGGKARTRTKTECWRSGIVERRVGMIRQERTSALRTQPSHQHSITDTTAANLCCKPLTILTMIECIYMMMNACNTPSIFATSGCDIVLLHHGKIRQCAFKSSRFF